MSRTLLTMKVLSNADFYKQLITMGNTMAFGWFSISSATVRKAPITTGITVASTSHNFCTCNLKSWYLVVFCSSFTLIFWSAGTVMSLILHYLFSLSVTTIFGLQCSISVSVWIVKPQSILNLSFSSPSLPCLLMYWFPARTENELTIWVTFLTFSL